MKRVILAYQLLTRLPIRRRVDANARMLAGAAAFYPLCGFTVGLISAFAWLLAYVLFRGHGPNAASTVGALVAVIAVFASTGGLHMDGLADTFDGIMSARAPERMLEIMKDSRMGVMGAIALILSIAARIVIIGAMEPQYAPFALIAAPCAAKTGIAAAAWVSPYARKEGLGQSVTEHTRAGIVFANAALATALCSAAGAAAFLGPALIEGDGWLAAGLGDIREMILYAAPIALAPILALLLGALLSRRAARLLGGVTGDILGAVNEVTEISVMLLVAVSVW